MVMTSRVYCDASTGTGSSRRFFDIVSHADWKFMTPVSETISMTLCRTAKFHLVVEVASADPRLQKECANKYTEKVNSCCTTDEVPYELPLRFITIWETE